ncbi:MAG: 2'-deoxycytidine 5'-triphosphate deaminase [Alphaproteobacteria bacterium]|nr:2'-deoxycytidine 5'-triphosphate deaminase [Alphaproteobacteria bacterium]
MKSPLHPGGAPAVSVRPAKSQVGILPYQAIRHMVREQEISAAHGIADDQVQPASLDLRLGSRAYRVRASALPGRNSTVMARIRLLDSYEVDISSGAVLERECVYIVPLMESVRLPKNIAGFANPKSTTGRLDILTRLLTDNSAAFDQIERGYEGPLYIEIVPRTFSVVVREGARLNQIRFRRGIRSLPPSEFELLRQQSIISSDRRNVKENMFGVTIDLLPDHRGGTVGYRARRHTGRIDLDRVGYYDPLDFWEPIFVNRQRTLILDPNDFYILVTKEAVRVPPEFAAEMVAYDATVGEFRVHYAGFFDPGFGWDIPAGARAVLEVRSHEVPFMLEHGQTVGWLRYEPMAAAPDRLYGAAIGSSYQSQTLRLAKQFRQT